MFVRCAFFLAVQLPGLSTAAEISRLEAAGKPMTVCRVELGKDRLQLFLRDESGKPFRRFEPLETALQQRGERLVFAMNGGMFQKDLSPLGLCVSDGKIHSPLNTASGDGNFFLKPNGVFLVTDKGAQVIESQNYPKLGGRILLATQSGPLLVSEGRLHPAFNASSPNRLIRNGVGVDAKGMICFAISEEPVNFHEFATFFRDTLKCPNALYLDGVVSSLHAPSLKRSDSCVDLGPILGVVEKLPSAGGPPSEKKDP